MLEACGQYWSGSDARELTRGDRVQLAVDLHEQPAPIAAQIDHHRADRAISVRRGWTSESRAGWRDEADVIATAASRPRRADEQALQARAAEASVGSRRAGALIDRRRRMAWPRERR